MSRINIKSGSTDWLTLIANLGVIAGLMILTYELHQANKLSETQAYLERLDQMQQVAADFSQSDYLPGVYTKIGGDQFTSDAIGSIESLTDIERSRVFSWERGIMLRMSAHYYQYLQGYLDQQTGDKILTDARENLPRWNALGIEIEGQEFRKAVEKRQLAIAN